jgi:16S rRNA (guanine527-N7)-methyltransferase
MQDLEVIKILKKDLYFTEESIEKIRLFNNFLLEANKKHNFISKSSEKDIWSRHVLDSAQLVKFIDFRQGSLSDLGTGAGFPGLVLAIFNTNRDFHVKLYEKSPVKRSFLEKAIDRFSINAQVNSNIYEVGIDTSYIICRAFKKLDAIIQVSREIAQKPHKLIVLKGQNAQKELNKAFKKEKYNYKLEQSITNKDSKIIIVDFKK